MRDTVKQLTKAEAFRLLRDLSRPDMTAGCGHKSTADCSMAFAWRHSLPYLTFEHSFIYSINLGNLEKPPSLIIDPTGL